MKHFIIMLAFLLCGDLKLTPAYSQIHNSYENKTNFTLEDYIKGKFGKKIALLIGVHNPPPDNLEYTTNDVENIGRVLANEFGYEIKKIIKKDATKTKILKAFDDLTKEAGEYDQLIIFFSGHGITAKTNPDMGFLYPSDGDKNNLFSTAINISEIANLSSALRAKHVLFLIDSCYSGIAEYYKTKDLMLPDINMVKYFLDNKARQVFTAGKAGEIAVMDPHDKKMSLFTYYLKEGLTRGSDNYFKGDIDKNSIITAKELYIYVQKEMFRFTDKQHPQYFDYKGTQAEFVFLPRSRIGQGPAMLDKPKPVVVELPQIEDRELQKIKELLPRLSYDLSNVGDTLGKISSEMNFDDKKAISGLLQFFNDPDPLMRWRAAMLTFRSKESGRSGQLREKIVKLLIDITDKLDNNLCRNSSIEVLVKLHCDEAQDLISHLAKSDVSPVVRQTSIRALKKVGTDERNKEEVFVYIMKFDDIYYTQEEAMRALAELFPIRASKEIPAFLSAAYVNDSILKTAIRLVGDLKIKDTVTPLLNILKSSLDLTIIDFVVNALIKIDDERAVSALAVTMNKLSSESYPEKMTKENLRKYLEKKQ